VPFTVANLATAHVPCSGWQSPPVGLSRDSSGIPLRYHARMDAASGTAPSLDGSSAPVRTGGLTDRDRAILEFERQWWRYAGGKEQAIRDLFGMSATRYYQLLNALIDQPEALAQDPMLVKRLRRLRSSRQRARSARRLGVDP
jgi:hypothetical protein